MNIYEQPRDAIGRERITCHSSVCTDSLEGMRKWTVSLHRANQGNSQFCHSLIHDLPRAHHSRAMRQSVPIIRSLRLLAVIRSSYLTNGTRMFCHRFCRVSFQFNHALRVSDKGNCCELETASLRLVTTNDTIVLHGINLFDFNFVILNRCVSCVSCH